MRPGDRHTLAHALRELRRVVTLEAGQADLGQDRAGPFPCSLLGIELPSKENCTLPNAVRHGNSASRAIM